MPIVPYMPLSEMIMIGLTPYWRAVAISLPVIKAPPSPTKATTCVPGRRNAAATAIGIPEPMAVAAALRRPGTQVVAFVGDGGALMTGNEIATARQYGVNPIMIISDNGMYGTIGMHSYVRYPERPFMAGTRLTNPDFAQWGRSFGAEGITISGEAEVADGIARAFAVKTKPVVVHCRTSQIQMSAWRRYTRSETLQ